MLTEAGFLPTVSAMLVASLLVDNNNTPFNACSILYTDLLTPLIVVLLLWLSRAKRFRLR